MAMPSNVNCGVHHRAHSRLLAVDAHLNCTLRKWITVRKRGGEVKEFLIPEREKRKGRKGNMWRIGATASARNLRDTEEEALRGAAGNGSFTSPSSICPSASGLLAFPSVLT